MGYMRYQRGSVVKRGKKGQQVWYGVWREDVPKPDGDSLAVSEWSDSGLYQEFRTVRRHTSIFRVSWVRNHQLI